MSLYGSFSHVRSAMSIDQSLLLIIQKLTNINVAESFTSMCFESKKWVSSTLVPCILELHLELRRFGSMGKSWNTKYRGTSVVIVPYIRDNQWRNSYGLRVGKPAGTRAEGAPAGCPFTQAFQLILLFHKGAPFQHFPIVCAKFS